MVLKLDMKSDTPIYVQLRNQIVLNIGEGNCRIGENLPTVRQLASDIGVNPMTVSKAYGILKQEGFIETDRRNGAKIMISREGIDEKHFEGKMEDDLKLLLTEAKLKGYSNEELFELCKNMITNLQIKQVDFLAQS